MRTTSYVAAVARVVLLAAAAFGPATAQAWGWEAHRRIHTAAIELLPGDMRAAIAGHEDALILHSIDPDTWKDDPDERHRHWLDVELADADPHHGDDLARDWHTALARYGRDSLRKIGVLPWRIAWYTDTVSASMRSPSPETWVKTAALGHYVADAHMPMHTTVNYDGQLTGNRGIHFRFEWWMFEGNWDRVHVVVDSMHTVTDPLEDAWEAILRSHGFVDSILAADSALRRAFRDPVMREDGRPQADEEFDSRLFESLGPLATDQMAAAASAVASYWHFAWVRAGKPDLRGVRSPPEPAEH